MSVHPPQDEEGRRWTTKEQNAMWVLKQQLGGDCWVQPVHRLDRATSGVVVYALNRESTRWLSDLMKGRNVHKEYFAFVRGYTNTVGVIDKPLDGAEAVSL
ncbi:pseudouridine synthase [Dunaliella salina]|uniref:Pseudouridine synthase n=1 Tax=Dunaliella salina TaxID=3046 RepID=A0ABQ7GSQ2_DUNSA|nr:pseudouridine synthase [Dunaliella salina]|eukprot:KAF5837623.1 pseudouridine synthase [Dunaliella salina]